MALASLIVKIGARDEEVLTAFASVSQKAKLLDADIAKLGDTPVAVAAQKSLDQMGQSMAAASASWAEFVAGFNIESAIANPMGVAKEAAFAFADSIGGVALAAAATVASLVAVGGAIYKLAANAAEVGASLGDMADKTGMSVPALSRLQNAAKVAGSDLGTLTNAVFMIEQRMGEGGAKWDDAIGKMGLSTEQLRAAGPDRLLQLITEGLSRISEPADQAKAGVALMGKSFKDVVPVLLDLNAAFALTNDITPWTADQAKDAETFKMQMASLVVHAEALGTAIGRDLIPYVSTFVSVVSSVSGVLVPLMGRLTGITGMVERFGEAWGTAAAAIDVFRGKATKLPAITGDAAAGLKEWQASVAGLAVAIHKPGDAKSVTGALLAEESATKELARTHGELIKTQNEAAAAAKKHAAEMTKLAGELRRVEGGSYLIPPALEKIGRSFDETKIDDFTNKVGELEQNAHLANFGFAGMVDSLKNVGQAGENTAKEIERLAAVFEFTGPIKQKIKSVDTGIHDLAQSFVELAQIAGDDFGGIVKDIALVVSAMDVGAKAGKDFKEAITLGEDGQRSWKSATVAVIGMVGAMDQATKSTSRWQATLGGAATGAKIGSAFGPWGTIIGGIAGAFVGLIRSAGAAERAINPIREQFVQLHGGLDALDKAAHNAGTSLTAMLNAKNAEQYKKAIDDLNAALDIQNTATEVLDEAVQRYGFSIEELGPKFAAQKLNEQAGSLLQDYEVLTAAGVDHIAIINKMAPTLQAYVEQAQKTGTAIPEAMRPILQAMIDLGMLTDASGAKMTDLEGLTFTETLDKKFSDLIDTINKLTDAISRGLGTAIKNLPAPTPIHVPVYFDPQPGDYRGFAGGGVVQRFASGGRVLPFLARGTDTVPAMLTPGERVLSVTETQAYEAGGRGAGMSTAALERKIEQLDQRMAERDRVLPKWIRDAVILAS